MSAVRSLILAFAVIGGLLFTAAFLASFLRPGFVEQVAKRIIRYHVERTVREKVESIDADFLSKRAERLTRRHAEELAFAKRQLSEGLPERIAAAIAEMQNLDCECRHQIEKTIRHGFEWRIVSVSHAKERLTTLIRTKYMETAEKLTREFRIFTGTNALVFALLAVATLVKRRAGVHLLPPTIVLLLATTLTAYLYLFNQNWLHTIVFSDYVGFAYIGYLTIVFAFLSDIFLNRARLTTAFLNQFLNAIGSTLVVVPC